MEVKACMGCFVEWDRERDECPVCGWSPQKPLEEDKNGWHQGKTIFAWELLFKEKRFCNLAHL